MKKLSIFVVLLFSTLAVAKVNYAWWVTFESEPQEESFRGIPADKFSPEFVRIQIFDCSNASVFSADQCQEIDRNGVTFSTSGDFNNDGNIEHWYTGVAVTSKGEYFKILFALNDAGELQYSLKAFWEKPGFSAFLVRDGKLAWSMCMECGHLADVTWSDGKWELDWGDDYG